MNKISVVDSYLGLLVPSASPTVSVCKMYSSDVFPLCLSGAVFRRLMCGLCTDLPSFSFHTVKQDGGRQQDQRGGLSVPGIIPAVCKFNRTRN